MKRERSISFLVFVVCLAVAAPLAWGDGSVGDLQPRVFSSLSEVVTLCHVPPGDPDNARTIVLRESWGAFSVRAHLAHGDYLGECHPACQLGVPSPVPKTGQTGCWDQEGNPIECAGTGHDGEDQAGVSVSPRFTDNLDGTVTDNLTGLIWLRNANCFGPFDYGTTWADALSDANTLASGTCGLSDGSVAGDWELPTLRELQSLIDYGHSDPPLPAGHPFSAVKPYYYWSSTTYVHDPRHAWIVLLVNGYIDGLPKSEFNTACVWPVRRGR